MSDIFLVRTADKATGVFKNIGANQHPMNLVCLATWLRERGHLPEVIDLEIEPFSYLEQRLKLVRPFLVGVTAMTPNIPEAKRICSMCRSLGIQTVLGGAHPSALPVQTLKDTGCDYVVIGEGEEPLCSLLESIKKDRSPEDIKGIAFLKNGQSVINKPPELIDIERLPFPDRRFLNLGRYFGEVTPGIPDKSAVIFTSRGCPYSCGFCASRVINRQRVRFRSIARIFEEIEDIVALGFEHITIDDEAFMSDRKRVMEFCSGLITRYPRLSWDCDSRVDLVEERLLAMMKKSNCRKIAFGVESGSPRILKSVNKNINIDQIKHAFGLTKKYKILAQGFFMVGFPEETPEDIRATENLILEIKPDFLHLTTAVPYPGTPIYDYMLKEGLFDHMDWGSFLFFGKEIPWNTRHFRGKDIIEIRKKISRRFYFCPSYIFRKISSIRTIRDLRYLVKGGLIAWKAFYR